MLAIILSILVVAVVLVILKYVADALGIPQPINWLLLAILAVVFIIIAIKHPFINI